MCECKHFTDGPDCEKCQPFYNDAPWGRATSKNVHECKGKSSFFFKLIFVLRNLRTKKKLPFEQNLHRCNPKAERVTLLNQIGITCLIRDDHVHGAITFDGLTQSFSVVL